MGTVGRVGIAGLLIGNKLHRIQGTTHYYLGQTDMLAEAVRVTKTWLENKGFVVS